MGTPDPSPVGMPDPSPVGTPDPSPDIQEQSPHGWRLWGCLRSPAGQEEHTSELWTGCTAITAAALSSLAWGRPP